VAFTPHSARPGMSRIDIAREVTDRRAVAG